MRITAARADELVGKGWFAGYTPDVEFHEEAVTVDEFDAEARYDALGDTEHVLFYGGLTVRGTLDLAKDVHSIYAVRGGLRAGRVALGDAVLFVNGVVTVDEWLFGTASEGIFRVGGYEVESDRDGLLARITAPLAVLYDRNRGQWVLSEHGQRRGIEDLLPDVFDDGVVDADRLRARIIAGRPVFRPLAR